MITLSETALSQIVSTQVKKELAKHHNKEETAKPILPPIFLFDKLRPWFSIFLLLWLILTLNAASDFPQKFGLGVFWNGSLFPDSD